jgi:hypothetical protein
MQRAKHFLLLHARQEPSGWQLASGRIFSWDPSQHGGGQIGNIISKFLNQKEPRLPIALWFPSAKCQLSDKENPTSNTIQSRTARCTDIADGKEAMDRTDPRWNPLGRTWGKPFIALSTMVLSCKIMSPGTTPTRQQILSHAPLMQTRTQNTIPLLTMRSSLPAWMENQTTGNDPNTTQSTKHGHKLTRVHSELSRLRSCSMSY